MDRDGGSGGGGNAAVTASMRAWALLTGGWVNCVMGGDGDGVVMARTSLNILPSGGRVMAMFQKGGMTGSSAGELQNVGESMWWLLEGTDAETLGRYTPLVVYSGSYRRLALSVGHGPVCFREIEIPDMRNRQRGCPSYPSTDDPWYASLRYTLHNRLPWESSAGLGVRCRREV
ncbi:hypothetical protein Tco_0448548 [Tanacetum coccineum]